MRRPLTVEEAAMGDWLEPPKLVKFENETAEPSAFIMQEEASPMQKKKKIADGKEK